MKCLKCGKESKWEFCRDCKNRKRKASELLSKLQPTAVPSYIVSSPYTSIYPPATTTTAGA